MAATLLAACGSGGGAGSGTSSNLPGSPIVVGAMVNISGLSNASEKPVADVLKAWAAYTNENGGIAGHPVEVRVEDTRGDAPTASSIAENFIADDSVVAVLMSSGSTEGAVGQQFAAADVAVSGTGYNPQVWSKLKNFYTIGTTFPALVNVQIQSALKVGSKTIASVACAENPNCLSANPIFEAAVGKAGATFAGVLQVAATAPNYTAECLQLVGKHVDFAQLSISEETSSRVVTDCQRQGYTGWFGASSGSVTPGLYDALPHAKLAGGLNGFPWWIDTPPVQKFRQVMESHGVTAKVYGGTIATGSWAAAELFRTALSGIGPNDTVTRETVQKAYGSVKDQDLGGLLPMKVSYTAGQPAPPVPCYWVYTYSDGKFGAGSETPTCDGATG